MKTLGLLAAGVLISAATFAQTTTTPSTATPTTRTPAEQGQMKDMRQDIRAYDNEKADAKAAINKGDFAAAKTDIAAAKTDRTDIKADAATLKSEGVEHPVALADKQVKTIDKKEIKTTETNLTDAKKAEQADVKSGNITGAQAEQKDIKADRKDLKADIREARRDGVKHPAHRRK